MHWLGQAGTKLRTTQRSDYDRSSRALSKTCLLTQHLPYGTLSLIQLLTLRRLRSTAAVVDARKVDVREFVICVAQRMCVCDVVMEGDFELWAGAAAFFAEAQGKELGLCGRTRRGLSSNQAPELELL